MAVDIPLIAIRYGTEVLYLHNHGEATAYEVATASFPAPQLKSQYAAALALGQYVSAAEMHEPAERGLEVSCVGDTSEEAEEAANTLLAASMYPGATLEIRHALEHTLLTTTIRSAQMVSTSYDPMLVSGGRVDVSLTLVTDPYWYAPVVTLDTDSVSVFPSTYSVNDVPGEVPALTRIRLVCTDDLPSDGWLSIGIRSNPLDGFSPIQDYAGTGISDEDALNGSAAFSGTLTSTMTTIGIPNSLDTEAHRGKFHLSARLKQFDSKPADTTYRAAVTVSGSALVVSTTKNYTSVAASDASTDFECVRLADVTIPSGSVPAIDTGSGYAAEELQYEQTSDNGTLTFSSAVIPFTNLVVLQQTFDAFDGYITSFKYTIDTAPSSLNTRLNVALKNQSSSTSLASALGCPTSAGEHTASFSSPYLARAGETLVLEFTFHDMDFAFTVSVAYGYSMDGQLYTSVGTPGVESGRSMVFGIYGQLPLSFSSKVEVQAANSGGDLACLDWTCLTPIDEGAAIIDGYDFSAGQGVLIDEAATIASRRNVYLADADGVGYSLLTNTELHGTLMLRPGDNTYVLAAHTPKTTAPGGGSIQVTYYPRYLTAGCGDA